MKNTLDAALLFPGTPWGGPISPAKRSYRHLSAADSKGGRCRKGERRPAARRGAKNANKKSGEPCGSPYCLYAALRLLPVPDASGLASFLAFALAANSCFTLRAIASASTL